MITQVEHAHPLTSGQSGRFGLQWADAFADGHAFGMANRQPAFAARLDGGVNPMIEQRDRKVVQESCRRLEHAHPARIDLSRFLGASAPGGPSVSPVWRLSKPASASELPSHDRPYVADGSREAPPGIRLDPAERFSLT